MYIGFHGGAGQSEILFCGWTEMVAYRQIIYQVY